MISDFSHVLSPIRLGNTWFRNRIFAAPASLPDYSNEAGMTDRQKAFYALRARGGAADELDTLGFQPGHEALGAQIDAKDGNTAFERTHNRKYGSVAADDDDKRALRRDIGKRAHRDVRGNYPRLILGKHGAHSRFKPRTAEDIHRLTRDVQPYIAERIRTNRNHINASFKLHSAS